MKRETEHDADLIDLGAASTETRGGLIAPPVDERGFYSAAGISDD